MQVIVFLMWMAAGGILSLLASGFEARRELLLWPPRDRSDRMFVLTASSIIGTILGLVGGAICAAGGSLIVFPCFVLFTATVVFVIYRVMNFARWLNKSIDEHPLSDRGSRHG